ncbi:hypothetical protein [Pseudotabrizicola sediminis]|uniref:hypothetical protein n=1 Tax=Pseudotabrizicola sediminis TaxID=2486418 RepID=UPI00338FE738
MKMLANPQLVKIHFETHDDLVLVWDIGAPPLIAELVQVKGGEADKLWSVADLCHRRRRFRPRILARINGRAKSGLSYHFRGKLLHCRSHSIRAFCSSWSAKTSENPGYSG